MIHWKTVCFLGSCTSPGSHILVPMYILVPILMIDKHHITQFMYLPWHIYSISIVINGWQYLTLKCMIFVDYSLTGFFLAIVIYRTILRLETTCARLYLSDNFVFLPAFDIYHIWKSLYFIIYRGCKLHHMLLFKCWQNRYRMVRR